MNLVKGYNPWRVKDGYMLVEIDGTGRGWVDETFKRGDVVVCYSEIQGTNGNSPYYHFVMSRIEETLSYNDHIIRIDGPYKYGTAINYAIKRPLNWDDYLIDSSEGSLKKYLEYLNRGA